MSKRSKIAFFVVCAALITTCFIQAESPTSTKKEALSPVSLVTKDAPDFKAKAVMPDGAISDISLSSFEGKKYVVLFFYPLDFTFVCPTEILAFDRKIKEFEKRNCQVIGVSVDSEYTHLAWRNTPHDCGGIGEISYPLVADLTKNISKSYGVLFDSAVSLRGLFLIDKKGVIRHSVINDLPLGRNVDEAIRMVDALQHFEKHGEVCPANWDLDKEALKPTTEGIADYLEKHTKQK